MSNFHSLTVSKIRKETPESSTLFFAVPSDIKDSFSRKAGQYLTLQCTIDGEEVRRAYSICTGVSEAELGVTVKVVRGGLMSTYLNEELKEGQSIQVMAPEGNFVVEPNPDLKRTHVFIAAGSGITPIMSMIRTILEEEGKSVCHLIYSNRNSNTIIFKSALEELQSRHEGQLFVEHVLSRPVLNKQPGISGFFKKPVSAWKGKTGRIDEALLDNYLEEHKIDAKNADFYICGPGPMIENIEKHLKDKVSHSKQVHVEYFSAPLSKGAPTQAAGSGHVEVSLNGKNYQLEVPAEKTILDVLIEKGAEPPYSCTSGACSSCMAKVTEGKVSMDACFALDEDEIADGYVLTCQAHPQSAQVKLDFDA